MQYILRDGEPFPVDDVCEWARWFEKAGDERSIGFDETPNGNVSTVFLGIDHNFSHIGPPVLWETLVFGGSLDGEQARYASRAAALQGHVAMLARVKEAGCPTN